MNVLNVTLILLCGVYDAAAGRRYIAIPVDGIEVIELSPATTRIARKTESYAPIPSVRQDTSINNPILDYVDFGGYTGSNGAFSWYADYPAHH